MLCHAVQAVTGHMKQNAAVQGDEERPGLVGYSQGNTVLLLLLSQRYLKQPHSIVMLESF